MLQSRRDVDFAHETFGIQRRGQLRCEHLDDHGTFERPLGGAIHHRHATAAELLVQGVLHTEEFGQACA